MKKPIAVVSMYRDDIFFADKWISYYGKIFGYEHIYLFVDGTDQILPKKAFKINSSQITYKEQYSELTLEIEIEGNDGSYGLEIR